MKTLISIVLLVLFLITPFAVHADVWVNGYYRSNGTYVKGHYRSNPDGNPYNNWSFPGNTNPHTGVTAGGSASSYLKNYSNTTSSGLLYSPSYTTSSVSSFCPANSYASGSSCKCGYGYVAQNGKCVSGGSVCSARLGIMSTYDSVSNTCKCLSGYEIGVTGTCVYKSPVTIGFTGNYSASNQSCPANSHESLTDSDKCTCDVGYTTNAKKTGCTLLTKKAKDSMCKDTFGSKSIWNGKGLNSDGTVNCLCKKGFEWSEIGDKCVKER